MVALALNPLAEEFCPCGSPPGLMETMKVPAGPPGLHTVADINDDILLPPGLMAPPGLECPPGLSCPPGLLRLAEHLNDEEVEEQESKHLSAPPGKFAPPGNFSLACPPGMSAPAGPPGVFARAGPPGDLSNRTSPPGVWAKDLDVLSTADISTDAESDSESSLDGFFCER